MYEILNENGYAEYDEFLKSSDNCDIMQSIMWSKIKNKWMTKIIVTRGEDGKIGAGILILIRKTPILPFAIFYAPRGPVFSSGCYGMISELARGIRELSKKEKALTFRADPAIRASDIEFIKFAESAGFKINDTGKNFGGVQPRFVYRLNIKDKTPDEIFANFHHKTRYNIRLAERKGVSVRIGESGDIDEFYKLLQETAERDHFTIRVIDYFRDMYKNLAPENFRLYVAEFDKKMIAAAISVLYGNTVWYLYGASSNNNRNLMPNYLLQWEMIKWAMDKNCAVYDFMGISGDMNPENPLYGLYKFKKGFSGEIVEYIGEIEIVYKPFINNLLNIVQKLRKKLGV